MLSPGDTAALLAILSEDRSLEAASSAFLAHFKHPTIFKACCALVLLIEDKRALKQPQRLVAFHILNELYRPEHPSPHPFISILVEAASDESVDKVERAFVLQILISASTNNKEIHKRTANEFVTNFDPSVHAVLSREVLLRQFADRLPVEPNVSAFNRAAISAAVPDPDILAGYDPGDSEGLGQSRFVTGDQEAAAAGFIQNSSLKGFEPPWVRPFPPRLPTQEGEVCRLCG